MRILFDNNILMDFFSKRRPHSESASNLMWYVVQRKITGLLGATTVTTLFYLLRKSHGSADAMRHIHRLLSSFDIATVDREVLGA